MTGKCYSTRATELLNLCTKPYSEYIGIYYKPYYHNSFYSFDNRAFSPIEYFINLTYNNQLINNEILIHYIKGKRKTLRFKSFN